MNVLLAVPEYKFVVTFSPTLATSTCIKSRLDQIIGATRQVGAIWLVNTMISTSLTVKIVREFECYADCLKFTSW